MNNEKINIGTLCRKANDRVTLSKMIAKMLEYSSYDNNYYDIDSNINNIMISENYIKYPQATINYKNKLLSLIIANRDIDDLSKICNDIIQGTNYTSLSEYGYLKDDSSVIYDEITENTVSDEESISLMVNAISNMFNDDSLCYELGEYSEAILNNNIHLKNMVKRNKNINKRIKTKYSDNKHLFRNHIKR